MVKYLLALILAIPLAKFIRYLAKNIFDAWWRNRYKAKGEKWTLTRAQKLTYLFFLLVALVAIGFYVVDFVIYVIKYGWS